MTASPTFQNLDDEKRRRVLAEAEREFAEQGFHGASMNRLTSRLGIAKGSLFKYFGNKEGCFRAVFEHAVQGFADRMRAARDLSGEAAGGGEDFFATVRRLLEAAARFVDEHPFIYRIYLKMQYNEDFPLRGVILPEVRRNVRKLLLPLVEKAMQRGEFRQDLDPDAAFFVVQAVCERFLQERSLGRSAQQRGEGEAASQQQADIAAALDLLRRGCSAKEHP